MVNILRIKRRASGSPGAPASLYDSELAYNQVDNTLYMGVGTGGAGGTASSILAIAGIGSFVDKSTDQTIGGIKSFSSTIVGSINGNAATATALANGRTISMTGDVTGTTGSFDGTGNATMAGTIASNAVSSAKIVDAAVTNAKLANMANNTLKGRKTAGTGVPEDLSVSDVLTMLAVSAGASVSSVNLTMPGIFSVANGPITSSGTLAVTLANQNANLVWAGPSSGGAASPAFRSLAVADIPTLTSAKISDFDTQVRLSRLDQMTAPTGSVSMNSQKITGLLDPVDPQDAATKAYVDASMQGLSIKSPVRAASVGNLTLSGAQTIDGVAVIAGDRVLAKNQSTPADNGPYVVAAGAWTRATDFDTSVEAKPGSFFFVAEGTVNADSGWVMSTDGPITLNTTSLAFVQFSGAGQITAGAGMTKTGNQLDIGGTSNRISVGTDSIDIDVNYVGQTSITTLGTVATGIWRGTIVEMAYGGLGASINGLANGSLLMKTSGGAAAAVAGTDYLSPTSTIDGGTF